MGLQLSPVIAGIGTSPTLVDVGIAGHVHFVDDRPASFGNIFAAADVYMAWDTDQTNDAFVTQLSGSNTWLITGNANITSLRNLGLDSQAHPSVVITSNTSWATATNEYLLISRNTTNVLMTSGIGSIIFQNLTDAASSEILRVQGPNRTVPVDDDEIFMSFYQDTTGGVFDETARITVVQADEATGTNDSNVRLSANRGSALTEFIRYGTTNIGASSVHINFNNADIDFIVQGNTLNNLLRVDASNDCVGFGFASAPSNIFVNIDPVSRTISADYNYFRVNETGLITVDTNIVDYRCIYFDQPNLSINGGVIITRGATLYVEGAPTNIGGGSITNPYSIFVNSGVSRFDDSILIGGIAPEPGSTNTLLIGNGTAPNAGVIDAVIYYSSDNSATNTIPSWYCEGAEAAFAAGDSVSGNRLRIRVNGIVYQVLCV